MDDEMKQVKAEIIAAVREFEAKLLAAFHGWSGRKHRFIEIDELLDLTAEERLDLFEERLARVERKLAVAGIDKERKPNDGRFQPMSDKEEKKARMIQMHAEGKSPREIADELDVGVATVSRWLKET